jgi:acyl dehydratase
MALKTDIRGMVWKYPDTFVVGREQVRQYARAVKSDLPATVDEAAAAELGHDALIAPLTFASVFAVMIQNHFFQHVDIGLETMQILQVDQKFLFHRPIRVGDALTGTMHIESVEERFGADIVVSRNTCVNDDDEPVMVAYTTLMGQQAEKSAVINFA